jgi:hypothetical protein
MGNDSKQLQGTPGGVLKATAAQFSAPAADGDVPYGPVIPDALDDGTIPVDKLEADLPVEVAKWNQAEAGDLIWLVLDGNVLPPQEGVPMDGAPDPIVLSILQADVGALGEGAHELGFRMGSEFGDPHESQTTTMFIDRTPPGRRQAAPHRVQA